MSQSVPTLCTDIGVIGAEIAPTFGDEVRILCVEVHQTSSVFSFLERPLWVFYISFSGSLKTRSHKSPLKTHLHQDILKCIILASRYVRTLTH